MLKGKFVNKHFRVQKYQQYLKKLGNDTYHTKVMLIQLIPNFQIPCFMSIFKSLDE